MGAARFIDTEDERDDNDNDLHHGKQQPSVLASSTSLSSFSSLHQQQQQEAQEPTTTLEKATATSSSSSSFDGYYYYYLSPHAVQSIPQYQFHGQDKSLLYKYILSPLAEWLVQNITPSTVAPNTITLFGLILMLISYCILWFYVPTLQLLLLQEEKEQSTNGQGEAQEVVESAPRWCFLFNCIAMLIYQTLDNMDGKQARKTKSSSPLGLLFDHGCDAINSIFGSANWIIAMGLNPIEDTLLCWILVIGPYLLFYIATWEEYYTGSLILPLMNGPNEGLFGGAMLSLTTYLYGCQYWQSYTIYEQFLEPILLETQFTTSLPKMRNGDFVVLASCIGFVQETILKSISVIYQYGIQALWDLVPFISVMISTLILGYIDPNIWLHQPRTTLHLMACLIVEMVTELMRAHISDEKFQPFQRWCILPLIVLTIYIVVANIMGATEVPAWIDDYLMIYTSAAWMYLIMKLCVIVNEICHLLNIYCFDIVTPRRCPRRTVSISNNGIANGHPKHE